MAALFVFCNRKPLNEDISSCLRDEVLTDFWSHSGVSLIHHFERGEGPGDEVV